MKGSRRDWIFDVPVPDGDAALARSITRLRRRALMVASICGGLLFGVINASGGVAMLARGVELFWQAGTGAGALSVSSARIVRMIVGGALAGALMVPAMMIANVWANRTARVLIARAGYCSCGYPLVKHASGLKTCPECGRMRYDKGHNPQNWQGARPKA